MTRSQIFWRRACASVLTLGLITSLGAIAVHPVGETEAAWVAAERAASSLGAGIVPPAAGVQCTTVVSGPLQTRAARISWTPVPEFTYEVRMQELPDGSPQVVSTNATSPVTLSQSLLSGVVSGLLQLLLGGGKAAVTVVAIHSSGWRSAPSSPVNITGASLLVDGFGGIKCAP